jgi:glucosamine-phosphate N-acetyltransferase
MSTMLLNPPKTRPGYTLRPIEQSDFNNGFLETLGNLSDVDLTPEEGIRIWRGRNAAGVRTVVAVEAGAVIGTASLILEQKFIHKGGIIGHIEDVAVHVDHQGKGVGSAVVKQLVELARESGCYKVILSCNDDNMAFYIRAGFRKYDNGMRIDLK